LAEARLALRPRRLLVAVRWSLVALGLARLALGLVGLLALPVVVKLGGLLADVD